MAGTKEVGVWFLKKMYLYIVR